MKKVFKQFIKHEWEHLLHIVHHFLEHPPHMLEEILPFFFIPMLVRVVQMWIDCKRSSEKSSS